MRSRGQRQSKYWLCSVWEALEASSKTVYALGYQARWPTHDCLDYFSVPIRSGDMKCIAEERRRASYTKPRPNEAKHLTEDWLTFFKSRGITRQVIDRNRLAVTKWGALMFRYFRDKEHVNNKYRTLDKKFSQIPGAEKVCPSMLFIDFERAC